MKVVEGSLEAFFRVLLSEMKKKREIFIDLKDLVPLAFRPEKLLLGKS